jgi:hypothetical protein
MDFEINPFLNPVFQRIWERIAAEDWVNSDKEPSRDSNSETEGQDTDKEQLIFSDEEDQKFREAVLQKPLPSFDGEFDLAADYSDLDAFEDKDFGNPLPTHWSRKSKRPSKANRAKPVEEADDCRPNSEQNWFSLLKELKKSSNLLKSILSLQKNIATKWPKRRQPRPLLVGPMHRTTAQPSNKSLP